MNNQETRNNNQRITNNKGSNQEIIAFDSLNIGFWNFFGYCLLVIGIFVAFFISVTFSSAASLKNQVCFGEKCVNVEVVEKQEDLSRGLMLRKSLSADSGMLFIFQTSWPYAFWMKDTLIPLDMIWIDETRRIVHIEHNVPPCTADPCPRYVPAHEALYVLEVNAGYAQKSALKLGDTAEFRLNAF